MTMLLVLFLFAGCCMIGVEFLFRLVLTLLCGRLCYEVHSVTSARMNIQSLIIVGF